MSIPPPAPTFEILESDPGPATATVFNQGIPATNPDDQMLSVVVFSPNLQLIASLDNTQSQATSTYSAAVTHGFTFSTTQSVTLTDELGVSILIVTAKMSIAFALSFTEQWTTTVTDTMTFSCPAGQQAFTYQGTLMAKVMAFDTENGTYSWYTPTPTKALTQIIVTSSTPIGAAPSNPVTIQS